MTLRPFLIPLAAGARHGSGAVWLLPESVSRRSSSANATEAVRHPVPMLVPPAKLAPVDAETALGEWLALPQLADDSPLAEQAACRTRLRALLARLPDESLPGLLDTLVTREVEAECALRRLAFEVWTERNPVNAAAWSSRQTAEHYTKKHRRSDTTLAVLAWSRTDWNAAYTWTNNLTDASLNGSIASTLLEQLTETDPSRALTIAQSRGDDFFKSARGKIFKVWAKTHPADAVRWFTPQLTANDSNRWAMQEAAIRWITAEPREALDWLLQPDPADTNSRSLLESMMYQVASSPEAAKALANALRTRDDLTDQNKLLTNLVGYWQNRDATAAIAWIDIIKDPTQRGDIVDQITRRWGISDGLARLELNLRLPEGKQRDEAIKSSLTGWAKSDPDKALAWLEKHPNPEYNPIVDSIQGVIVGNLAATDLPAAISRWETLPEGDAKKAATGPIVEAWAKKDPQAAADWLVARLKKDPVNGHNSNDPLPTLLRSWSTDDPAAALRWAEDRMTDQNQWSIVSALTDNYGNEDFPDPKIRADLYATVKDENLRKNLSQRLAWNWLRNDYQAASAWLESSDAFTPEQVAQLLVQNDPYKR